MCHHAFFPVSRQLQRMIVWGLLVVLPIYGVYGVLLQALGPTHRHQQVAASDTSTLFSNLEQQWRGLIGTRAGSLIDTWHARQPRAEAHRHAAFESPHHHGLLERHHHDVGDASVVTADAATSDMSGDAGAASVVPLFGPAFSVVTSLIAPSTFPWPSVRATLWRSRALDLLERPPRVGRAGPLAGH